jgi:hypothetical protein
MVTATKASFIPHGKPFEAKTKIWPYSERRERILAEARLIRVRIWREFPEMSRVIPVHDVD